MSLAMLVEIDTCLAVINNLNLHIFENINLEVVVRPSECEMRVLRLVQYSVLKR